MQTVELVGAPRQGLRLVRHQIATAAELADAPRERRGRWIGRRVHRGKGSAMLRAMRVAIDAQAGRSVSVAALGVRYGLSKAQAKRYRAALRALGLAAKLRGGKHGNG